MKDLKKVQAVLIVKCHELVQTRKELFAIRDLCKGDYDKIFQLDDILKDIERARVNIVPLILDMDIEIAKRELAKLSD
jgi:hypothetical protein